MSKVIDEIIAMLETEHGSFYAVNDSTIKGKGITITKLGNVLPHVMWFTSVAEITIKGSKVNTTIKDLINLEKAARRWYKEAGIDNYK